MPYDDASSIVFSTLASNEKEAQELILHKVVNEIYKSELKKHFSDDNNKPIIYDHGDVFIQFIGELKFFTQ